MFKIYDLSAIIDVMSTEEPYKDGSMLLAFRAENIRSFRDELELWLLATALAEKDVPQSVPWREGGRPVRMLPLRASSARTLPGRPTLLRVMADMRAHVLHSFRAGDSVGGKTPTTAALADLVGRYEDARRRAKALDEKHRLDGSSPRSNPSSGTWCLIDSPAQLIGRAACRPSWCLPNQCAPPGSRTRRGTERWYWLQVG
jgi:hypothetical protein